MPHPFSAGLRGGGLGLFLHTKVLKGIPWMKHCHPCPRIGGCNFQNNTPKQYFCVYPSIPDIRYIRKYSSELETGQPYRAGALESREVGAGFDNAKHYQNPQKFFFRRAKPMRSRKSLRLSRYDCFDRNLNHLSNNE
jgi:hypothetical protein